MKLAPTLLTALLLTPLAKLPASDLPPAGVNAQTNPSVADAGQIVLIVPAPTVHIPNGSGLFDKTLTQTDAAQRLQMLIHRATGFLPDIVSATHAPASGTRVFVGYGQHLKGKVIPPTRPEGLKIQELDGCLYLLGEIVPAGVNNCPGPMDRGLMHAVETYAETVLGYRFLFSTPDNTDTFELGTVVPKIDRFTIEPGLLIEDAPAFQHRVINTRPRPLMGLRSGSAPAFFCNHSYGIPWWAATYGKTHPEMFIPKQPSEIAGGTSDAVTAMASQPKDRTVNGTFARVASARNSRTVALGYVFTPSRGLTRLVNGRKR